MDTSQYLSMFLEESMDNLQTLNEALLQLEQEPNNVDKLNEIFRKSFHWLMNKNTHLRKLN